MSLNISMSSGGGGNSVVARSASVSGTATGVVYTVAHLLGSTSVFSLVSGSNANLAINSTTGAITATAALGVGVSQLAIVREAISAENRAEEYPLTLTGAVVVPAAPTLSLAAGNGQISVAWTDGSNGGAAITAHNLYRGTTTGGEVYIGQIATGSPYVDTGLTNGTTYYYKLSAVNSVGEGALSSEQSATPQLFVFTQPANRLFLPFMGDSRPAQDFGESGTMGVGGVTKNTPSWGPSGWMHMYAGNRTMSAGGANLGLGGEIVEHTLAVPRPIGTGFYPIFDGAIAGTALTISNFSNGSSGQLVAGMRIGGPGTGITPGTTLVSGSGNSWVVTPSQTVASFTGSNCGYTTNDLVAVAQSAGANVCFWMGTNSSDAAISPGGAAQIIMAQAIASLTNPATVYPPYGAVLPLAGGVAKNVWIIDEEPQGIDYSGAVTNARTLSRVGFIQGWVDFIRKYDYASGDALANPRVKVIKLWDDTRFYDPSTGANHRNYGGQLCDGLHSASAGASVIGQICADAITAELDASVNFALPLPTTADAQTLNAMVTNPCFTGSGGATNSSSTIVGAIPSNWNINMTPANPAGLTMTLTQTALGGSLGNKWTMRFTGSLGANCSVDIRTGVGGTALALGNVATDNFRLIGRISLSITGGKVFGVQPFASMNAAGGGGNNFFVDNENGAAQEFYSGSYSSYFKQSVADASHAFLNFGGGSSDMNWVGRGLTGAPTASDVGLVVGIAAGTGIDFTIEVQQMGVAKR